MTSLTPKIMKQVSRLESRRLAALVTALLLTIILIATLAAVCLWVAILITLELGSFELLTIFSQNPEVWTQYGLQTLGTFWMELPAENILLGLVSLSILGIIIYKTIKWWPIFANKWRYLTKGKPKL